MKKIFLVLAASLLTFGAAAQTTKANSEMMRQWRQTVQKRDISKRHLTSSIPQAAATKGEAKSTSGMPRTSFWFPGEWEEVQAVVVTPYYYYEPENHQGVNTWMADPLVPGVAQYYRYASGQWQEEGVGPYVAVLDNSSSFSDVAYYLMDAIQMGGAQAWVRVENFSDTTAVLNRLQRMGLRSSNIRFLEAPGNSFWYRDCGPICFYYGEGDTLGMLDFEYYPGRALDDSLPVYIERQFGLPNYTTMIEWEGGNCLVDGAGMVFSSDAIYGNNYDTYGQLTWNGSNPNTITFSTKPRLSNAQVKDSLEALIGPRATYIMTAFKYDGGTGHVDLYADMRDENTFVFSKMPDIYYNWHDYKVGEKNMDSLCSYESYFGDNYRSNFIPFPSTDNGGNFTSQSQYDSRYTRTYSNHTFVNDLIIQPCFSAVGSDGMPTAAWDRANIEQLKKAYPGYTIYCVDVRDFDGSGGAIHCITKQIPAEHPIRILHNNLHGNTGTTYNTQDAHIEALINNVDGIAEAKVYYRIDSGEWHNVDMSMGPSCDGGPFICDLPTTGILNGEYTLIEYYISATSNAGKTITKPMTANQGGYFNFYLGNNPNPPVAIETVDAEQRFGQFAPNPATDDAKMIIDLAAGESYNVSIIDQSGRTVHTSSLQASGSIVYTINASRLAAGAYTVVFDNGGQRVARKLIVQ